MRASQRTLGGRVAIWRAAIVLGKRLLHGHAGQATAEYVTITAFLLLGGIAATAGWPFFDALVRAYDTYLASVYYSLNLPLP